MSKRDQANQDQANQVRPNQNQAKRSRSALRKTARNESARERTARSGDSKRRRRYDPDEARVAPWGRRPDGTPHTQEEFRAFLREMVRELYGVAVGGEDAPPMTTDKTP